MKPINSCKNKLNCCKNKLNIKKSFICQPMPNATLINNYCIPNIVVSTFFFGLKKIKK